MLILTRRFGEGIIIGDNLAQVYLLKNYGSHVKVGIEAPKDIDINRYEIYRAKQIIRLNDPHYIVPKPSEAGLVLP